ncbi:MAG: response regulator [Deferribacterales bacterium]
MKPDNTSQHILIVDDDYSIRSILAEFLQSRGLTTSQAANGTEMFTALKKESIDLILLDLMMPGDDGLTLCRRLQNGYNIPVIILTAVDSETDRIIGLELGADDYVTKPFSSRELLARIRNILRRFGEDPRKRMEKKPSAYRFAGWTIDSKRRTLFSPDRTLIVLTSTEFDLLMVFVESAQRVINRDQLLDALHGRSSHQFDRSIDVQISRLRRKIETDPQNPEFIKTIRNEGYFFTPDIEQADIP